MQLTAADRYAPGQHFMLYIYTVTAHKVLIIALVLIRLSTEQEYRLTKFLQCLF